MRVLMNGNNWREKNPKYCGCNWVPAGLIVDVLRDGGLLPVGSLSLATDISCCRTFLEERWPEMTIDNRLERRENNMKLSFYKITTKAERDARKRKIVKAQGADTGTPLATPKATEKAVSVCAAPAPSLFGVDELRRAYAGERL